LYDFKHSGHQWYIHFSNFLNNNGFNQLSSDLCIFKKMGRDLVPCIIGVYVDDLLITGIKLEIKKIIYTINKENFQNIEMQQGGLFIRN